MMASTPASPLAPPEEKEITPFDKITDREKKNYYFLMGLYPNGRDLKSIISQVEETFKIDREIAEKTTVGMLHEFETGKLVGGIKRSDGTTLVMLTKTGKEAVFKFLSLLKDGYKEKFLIYVRDWMSKGDKMAEAMYKNEVLAMIAEKPHVACMLMTAHYENDIIREYCSFLGADADMPSIASSVLKYIGMLSTMGFIKSRTDLVNGMNVKAYVLSRDGKNAINYLFDVAKNATMSGASGVKNSARPDGEGSRKKILTMLVVTILSIIVATVTWQASPFSYNHDVLSLMIAAIIFPVAFMFAVSYVIPVVKILLARGKK